MRIAVIVGLLACAGAGFGGQVTTGSLVAEMVDMRYLSYVPDPFYETVQFSSHDLRSNLPGGPDWFANSDGFGREPIPNVAGVVCEADADGVGEYLLCDVRGPGAVVRMWSANMNGTIQVYLDGKKKPVLEGPAQDILRRPYDSAAQAAGLDASLLEGTFYQRDASYCPIPFAKRLRVTWTGKLQQIHFYEIQVRNYVPGAKVKTFSAEDLGTYARVIRETSAVLANPPGTWKYASDSAPAPMAARIAPGEMAELLTLEGEGAIERLTLKVTASDLDKALRQTILHIACDGYPWGQVQAPIGDFFGAAPGINPYDSVPFTVAPDGTMTCRYVMPFARSLRIAAENLGEQAVEVRGDALPLTQAWDDARSMHFRARWCVDHDLVADGGNGAQDLPFLLAEGTGVYVGTAVMLLNPNDVPSSGGNWWGEGDEKIFVDGESQPSTFGTGSEDYFNYSWSRNDIFGYPYCGQPRNDGPANRGFVTNQRWHILDALPFRTAMSFYMELMSHERTPGFSYARIGYHYGRPGLTDGHVTITREDVRPLELPMGWLPAARRGAADSEFVQAEDVLADTPRVRIEDGALWAGGKLARWRPAAAGEELRIPFTVAEDGNYALRVAFAMDAGSGKVSVKVDDKAALISENSHIESPEGVADLERPYRVLLRCLDLEAVGLDAGQHTVAVKFEGGAASVGVDFVWVQKRPGR